MTEVRRKQFILNRSKHLPFQFQLFTPNETNLIANSLDFTLFKPRHSNYKTKDFHIGGHSEYAFIQSKVDQVLMEFEKRYGFTRGDLEMLDCFFVLYDDAQPNLEAHTDGCLLSFNVQINDPTEFEGGGTRFVDDDRLVLLNQGECLCHSAKVLHEGRAITNGMRLILVGFVETHRPGILSKVSLYHQDLKKRSLA
jgi:hypothetical protein